MKIFIENRKEQKLSVLVEINDDGKGLAFVMHGLSGFKEQKHIKIFADAFLEEGFNVIRFDVTNTIGESEGNPENATVTSYYEDLEDVINWAKEQEWYDEPYYLIGHSLGGISIALFAEKHSEQIKGLAPISTVISGKLSLETLSKEELKKRNETGLYVKESKSKPGVIFKLNWHNFNNDKLRYDLMENVDKLTMPVLLIVGDKDTSTPIKHQKILFEKLPGEKELHIIKNAPHSFRDKEHLKEIKQIIKSWIEKTL